MYFPVSVYIHCLYPWSVEQTLYRLYLEIYIGLTSSITSHENVLHADINSTLVCTETYCASDKHEDDINC
jgi:hypothetical protein